MLNRLMRPVLERVQTAFQITSDQIEDQTHLNSTAIELPPTAVWVRRTTWVIVSGLGLGLVWACVARIDVVVPARGKLEPQSSSQVIQPRIGGVVTAVLVQEGQAVQQGQLLVQLDKVQLLNQLEGLVKQREPLTKRLAVLQAARQGRSLTSMNTAGLNIPAELLSRVENRNLLLAQLSGNPAGLAPDQRQRFDLFMQEKQDRETVSQFQVDSLQARTAGSQSTLNETASQLQLEQAQVAQLDALVRAGAISRRDYSQRVIQLSQLRNQTTQALVARNQSALEGMQAQVEGRRTVAQLYREVQGQLSDLDQQLDRTIEQDKVQLGQVESQINQINQNIQQQDLRAPVDGVVFDQQIKLPGVVTQAGQALMQITPNESLLVRLQVSNSDIGNIREGMPVDVRVDAYPFTEFGSIPGRVTRVSSDALPASPQGQGTPSAQTFFLVEVRLDRPFLENRGNRLMITPGMSVTGNIKTQTRAPISYVADQIISVFEGGKTVR